MRAVQIPKAGGPLELVEREVPQAGRSQVRLRVQACGVCHGDSVAVIERGFAIGFETVSSAENSSFTL